MNHDSYIPKEKLPRCEGKVCYSKRDAEYSRNKRLRPSKRRRKQKRNRPEFLRIYHCEKCNQWHLTHKPKNQ